MSIPADDLAFMFADPFLTVPVVCGTQSTRGYRETVEAVLTGDGVDVQTTRDSVLIRRGSLTNLTNGCWLTVDGERVRLRDRTREEDGAVERLLLAGGSA